MVTVHLTRTIHAAPQRVFDWLADPRSVEAMSVIRRAVWASGGRLLQAITSRMLASGIRAVLNACARDVEG